MRRHRAAGGPPALLLLDIGNTRLKWALCTARAFTRQGVMPLSSLRRSDAPLRALMARMPTGVSIVACNVAGAALEARVRACAKAAQLSGVRFVQSTARAAGVRNGYREAWRLGADRWVAMIGAHASRPRRALCLVSIGSALTIDLLTSAGLHLGGCIAPGPQMMIESLLQQTAGIRRRAQLGNEALIAQALATQPRAVRVGRAARSPVFAKATREALLAGARYACAALIERAAQQARSRVHGRVLVVVSGGGAGAIAPLLQLRYQRDDDLVLHGLATLARAWRLIA